MEFNSINNKKDQEMLSLIKASGSQGIECDVPSIKGDGVIFDPVTQSHQGITGQIF